MMGISKTSTIILLSAVLIGVAFTFGQYLPDVHGETVIYVYGTSGNDVIVVDETLSCVTVNNPDICIFEVDGSQSIEYIIYAGKGSDTITIIDGAGDDEYYIYDGPGNGVDSNTIYDGSGDDEYFIYMAGGDDSADIDDGLGNDVYFIYMAGGDDSAVIIDDTGRDSYHVYGGGGNDVLTVTDTCSTDLYEFFGGSKVDTFSIADCTPDNPVPDTFHIFAESSPTNPDNGDDGAKCPPGKPNHPKC